MRDTHNDINYFPRKINLQLNCTQNFRHKTNDKKKETLNTIFTIKYFYRIKHKMRLLIVKLIIHLFIISC